jgi:hypothetical protein
MFSVPSPGRKYTFFIFIEMTWNSNEKRMFHAGKRLGIHKNECSTKLDGIFLIGNVVASDLPKK